MLTWLSANLINIVLIAVIALIVGLLLRGMEKLLRRQLCKLRSLRRMRFLPSGLRRQDASDGEIARDGSGPRDRQSPADFVLAV